MSTTDPVPALELRGIEMHFGSVQALRGVDLKVRGGEILTLLGPSGSGKTTILWLIAGFERPTRGTIFIGDTDVGRLPPAKRNVGMVFQDYALFPHLTVAQNIAYGLKRHGIKGERVRRRVAEMLELVRLDGYGDRSPRRLSGGQQQRVAVARALAFGPALLLMDEPLGALDRALRTDLEDELRRIQREVGTTMIYVTHDQEEALALSDRIAVLNRGRIAQVGTAEELYERPLDRSVASLLGECNVFPVDRVASTADDGMRFSLRGRDFDAPSTTQDEVAFLVVRPERFRLRADRGDLHLDVVVRDIVFLGGSARINARHREFGTVVARVNTVAAHGLQTNAALRLFFNPNEAVVVGGSSPGPRPNTPPRT